MEQPMVRKRRVGVCKQKITERCVNISKIKRKLPFSDHSLCPEKEQR
jgi:hypothetical protein